MDDVFTAHILPRLAYRDFAAFALCHPATLRLALGCDAKSWRRRARHMLPAASNDATLAQMLQGSVPALQAGWRLAEGKAPREQRWTPGAGSWPSPSGKLWVTAGWAPKTLSIYDTANPGSPEVTVSRPVMEWNPLWSADEVWGAFTTPKSLWPDLFNVKRQRVFRLGRAEQARRYPDNACLDDRWSRRGQYFLCTYGDHIGLVDATGAIPRRVWSLRVGPTHRLCWLGDDTIFLRIGPMGWEVRTRADGGVRRRVDRDALRLLDKASAISLFSDPPRWVDLLTDEETPLLGPLPDEAWWASDTGEHFMWHDGTAFERRDVLCIARPRGPVTSLKLSSPCGVVRLSRLHAVLEDDDGLCVISLAHPDAAPRRLALGQTQLTQVHRQAPLMAFLQEAPAPRKSVDVVVVDLDRCSTSQRIPTPLTAADCAYSLTWSADASQLVLTWRPCRKDLDRREALTWRF